MSGYLDLGYLKQRVRRSLGRKPGGVESGAGLEAATPGSLDELADRAQEAWDFALNGEMGDRKQQGDAVIRAGRRALHKLADGEVDDEGLFGLEAIVRLTDRPSFVVKDGAPIVPVGSSYEHSLARQQVGGAVTAVGRLNVPEIVGGYLGTVFLVAEDLVMTNRHVADKVAIRNGSGSWKLNPALTPSVDFVGEHAAAQGDSHAIVDAVLVHPDWAIDLALLRVAKRSSGGKALPLPQTLAINAKGAAANRPVYVVGYPSWDPLQGQAALRRIFGTVLDVKRLAPGQIMDKNDGSRVFWHDCSTLKGNSGSCVVDLSTHEVVGLHSAGDYEVENVAASIPAVHGDPQLMNKGLNFQR